MDNGEHQHQATITKYIGAGRKHRKETERTETDRGMLRHESEPVWCLCEWNNPISKPNINDNREARAKKVRKQ